ncbi:hypothetical protein TNCV_1087831 [Trichonephila clavipes]|uniref:Uncharacterized protein n=1 Tax=Trichonephila clavipes TaxID=2585209 RepID=A0A8X6SP32_TRICX|nr:hypothetical protein TNCV_1087831 [Trichonephila clavipes]
MSNKINRSEQPSKMQSDLSEIKIPIFDADFDVSGYYRKSMGFEKETSRKNYGRETFPNRITQCIHQTTIRQRDVSIPVMRRSSPNPLERSSWWGITSS